MTPEQRRTIIQKAAQCGFNPTPEELTMKATPENAADVIGRIEGFTEDFEQATNQTDSDAAARCLKQAREDLRAIADDLRSRRRRDLQDPVKLRELEGEVIELRVGTDRDAPNSFWGDISGRVKIVRAESVTIWVGKFAIDHDAIVEPTGDDENAWVLTCRGGVAEDESTPFKKISPERAKALKGILDGDFDQDFDNERTPEAFGQS